MYRVVTIVRAWDLSAEVRRLGRGPLQQLPQAPRRSAKDLAIGPTNPRQSAPHDGSRGRTFQPSCSVTNLDDQMVRLPILGVVPQLNVEVIVHWPRSPGASQLRHGLPLNRTATSPRGPSVTASGPAYAAT